MGDRLDLSQVLSLLLVLPEEFVAIIAAGVF